MESGKIRSVEQIAQMSEQEMLMSRTPENMTTQAICKLIENKRKCKCWALEFLSSIYRMVQMKLTREQLLAAIEQADTLEDALESEDVTEAKCCNLRQAE